VTVVAFPIDIPNPIDGLFGGVGDFVGGIFSSAAGWAWDTVIKGIANWLAKGFVLLLSFVWSVMDSTSTPALGADWFSGRPGSPYRTTVQLAALLTLVFVFVAVIHAVLSADALSRLFALPKDLLVSVAGICYLLAFTGVAIELTDSATAYVWQQARPDAQRSADAIAKIAMTADPAHFLTPLLLLVGMAAMLALWIVLFVREALIYLVVALCPLTFAVRVWPAVRGVARKSVELLAALVVSKLPIGIAMAVGFSALGGVGATAPAGGDAAHNTATEFGTFVAGIVIFGVAAFMPYLVWRLLPVAEGALVAQGIASAPHRTVQTGMQYGYYAQNMAGRLAGPRRDDAHGDNASRGDDGDVSIAATPTAGSALPGAVASQPSAGGGGAAAASVGSSSAPVGASAAGPVAVVVSTGRAVKERTVQAAAAATSSPPGGEERDDE
jgi:hypothetical protein